MSKTVAIKADKARNLKFGTNSMVQAEEMLGKPITEFGDQVHLGDLRIILYVGLRWEDKELTLESTGDIMDEILENEGIDYLSKKLGDAIQKAFGQKAVPSKK
ncbi:hypothetical protein [Fictibacillus sp. 26RED30]|uniref:hypothetical protein n=1 Tax=Fictibacillus sp. 26RED30 TaxID=2745877 RepID=UPI0018CEE687|nr:hypothetical protein [Fictibacillus sp. 26RED30]MBH0159885.1 hypothetical protein [Fictibacillus sp. 26RED30]